MDLYNNDTPDLNWNLDQAGLDKALEKDKKDCDEEDQMVFWYHGKLLRADAEQLLQEASDRYPTMDQNGLFLVRDSTSSDVDFSLSFIFNKKCYHFYIHRPKEGYYRIDGGPEIHGLDMLIEHYTMNADKLPTALTKICQGTLPPPSSRMIGPTNILHRAVKDHKEEFVKKILDHPKCPDINAKNEDGFTALHTAASMGLKEAVALLLNKNADIHIKDCDGNTPLHKACAANRESICAQIINYDSSSLLDKNPNTGQVPLHVAAMRGNLACVELLLDSRAPIFPRDLNDETPVDLAEKQNRIRCLEKLEKIKNSKNLDTNQDFFHPDLDRQGAESLVKNHSMTDGLFLIRKSKTVENQNVLSLCHQRTVLNYEIKSKIYRSRRVHYIDRSPYHSSLIQLVEYYQYFGEGTPIKLQAYISSKDNKKVNLTTTEIYCNLSSASKPQKLAPKTPRLKAPIQVKPELPPRPPDPVTPDSPPYRTPPSVSPLQTELLNKTENDPKLTDIPVKDITKGNMLGEGEYGSVLKGVYTVRKRGLFKKDKHINVAIKTFHSVGNLEDFQREAEVMQSLKHTYIVELLGVCRGPPLMLVEEYVPMGSMLDFLEDHPNKVTTKELYLWAAQIANGMTHVEKMKLVHRDLAARNILLKSLQHVKISDFGLSRAMGSDKEYYKASQGGRWPIKWYAPESINFGHFSHASDVWSYGVTLWEMFSDGSAPFENMSGIEVIKYIEEGKRLQQPKKCNSVVYKIMTQCWSVEAENRPTFKQLNEMFEEDAEYACAKEIMADIRGRSGN